MVSGPKVIVPLGYLSMGRTRTRLPESIEFGRRVRSRRDALEWTQERLADTVGLHWTYLGSVERGERNVSLRNIVRLANGLGVDPGELVAGIEPGAAPR